MGTTGGATVDFYFGLTSRYSYLAETQVPRLAAETGATFVWKPLYTPDLMDRKGMNPFAGPAPSGAYDHAYRAKDLQRWAAHLGIEYVEPEGRVKGDKRLFAMAAVAGAVMGKAEEVSRLIFDAIFTGDRTELTRADLVSIAGEVGLDTAAFEATLDSPDTEARHDRHIEEAIAAGAFGAPTFICDGELWFGNDRLVLLEEWLKARS